MFVFRPTRAEATDVANAVLDGVDGFLLGAETLRGEYVAETIKTVLSISNQAELAFDHTQHFEYLMQVCCIRVIGSRGSTSLSLWHSHSVALK